MHAAREMTKHLFRLATNDAVVRTCHSDIGDERSSTSQHARISRRNMRVRTEHCSNTPVEVACKRAFLARCFHVRFDKHQRISLRNRCQHFIRARKRVIRKNARHQHASEQREHIQIAREAFACRDANDAFPLRSGREIRRTTDGFRGIFEDRNNPRIAIDVITERHCIDAELSEGLVQIRRQTRSIARILSIRDDAQWSVPLAKRWKLLLQNHTTRCAVDISKKCDTPSRHAMYTITRSLLALVVNGEDSSAQLAHQARRDDSSKHFPGTLFRELTRCCHIRLRTATIPPVSLRKP